MTSLLLISFVLLLVFCATYFWWKKRNTDKVEKGLVEYAWSKNGDPDEIISKLDELEITRKDLWTIAKSNWVNDELINYYLRLIVRRGDEVKRMPKVFAFNSFFFESLSTKGYSSVKRWTKKVDIFDKDIVIIPVHHEEAEHWCLIVIDKGKKTVTYYDSCPSDAKDDGCLRIIRKYLMEESNDKKKTVFDEAGWSYVFAEDTPCQSKLNDCGVFLCKFAELASRRAPVVFPHKDMSYYRQRIAYEIVKNKIK